MRVTCPECASDIPAEGVSLERGQATCASCERSFPLETLVPGIGITETGERPPPKGTKVVVHRGGPAEITLYIPSRRNLYTVLFTVIWNVIVLTVSAGILGAGEPSEKPFFLVPFLSLFWAVGIGLLIASLFSMFGKTLVHVGGGQVAVKKEVFGLGRLRRYPLEPGAVAGLAEAYEQNNQAVYACSITTGTKELKFGTFLSEDEKAWLVDVISKTLEASLRASVRVPESGVFCPGCGRALAGSLLSTRFGLAKCPDCNEVYLLGELVGSTQELAPTGRPVGTNVQVEESSGELRLVVPPMIATGAGKTVLTALVVFTVICLGALTASTIAAFRSERSLILVLIPVWALVLAIVAWCLSYFSSPLELTFAEGVVEKSRTRLPFRRKHTLPLQSRARVEFQVPDEDRPAGVRQAPPSWTPLSLRHEGGSLTFGFFLSSQEKRWLQQRINEFLEREEQAEA